MKTLWQVRRAALVRALGAIALSTTHKAPSKQTPYQRLARRWRAIGSAALLACAFLLPSIHAAQAAQTSVDVTTTSTKNPSNLGDSITITATASSGGNGVPTGTIQFFDTSGGTFLNNTPITLTATGADTSQAAVTTSALALGNHDIITIYTPTGNFVAGNENQLVQQVIPAGAAGTTTTLVSSQNPSETGQSVTFTAPVTAVSGSTAPTGTVTFQVDGTTASTPTLQTVGGVTSQATFTTSTLAGSATGTQHSIVAIYNPTGAFGTSSASLTQTVSNGIPTTVTVSGSPNPSAVNQSITVTATVAAAAGFTGTPTGTVDFSVLISGANHTIATGVTLSNGTASTTAPGTLFTAAQTDTLLVTYHATGNFQDQTVGQASQIITSGTATTATLTSSRNPSTAGTSVTFTATITTASGTPTGNVNFVDNSAGGAVIGQVTLSAVSGGARAAFTTSSLTAGTHNLEAVTGDATFAASTASLTQTVNTPAATSTTVASSLNPSLVGQAVTFTATVSAAGGATGTPTGTVQFSDNGALLGSPVTLTNGVATTPQSPRSPSATTPSPPPIAATTPSPRAAPERSMAGKTSARTHRARC